MFDSVCHPVGWFNRLGTEADGLIFTAPGDVPDVGFNIDDRRQTRPLLVVLQSPALAVARRVRIRFIVLSTDEKRVMSIYVYSRGGDANVYRMKPRCQVRIS